MSNRKIVIHWTAGQRNPTDYDLQHYHYLISENKGIYIGKKNGRVLKPEDNDSTIDGVYVAHCGGGNTRAIGVAICGYCDFKSIKNIGKYIPTKGQFEELFKLLAELCVRENINPTDKTRLYTHAEFGQANPHTTSFGKIDFNYIPNYWREGTITGIDACGDFIRKKVNWYYGKMKGN